MDALVFRVAIFVLALALPGWIALSLVVVLGPARYDRRHEARVGELRPREAARLIQRARGRPRTDWGRWRRVSALTRLARAHSLAAPRLLRHALSDPDPRIANAAVRSLGDLGDGWAIDILVSALREGSAPRSRIAAQLERLAPVPGPRFVPLLRHPHPAVRFWAATLLEPYPELGREGLIALMWDPDPNVRAAAVETLGGRSGSAVGAATLARLDDPAWFVRVHAARAAGHVVGADAAPSITPLLADEQWWVRTAAKDALRGMGSDAVPALLAVLGHEDEFARNGAAEVLQDVGFVDTLAFEQPLSPLLERIYEAGGERLREAAQARTTRHASRRTERAA
ncbi:MAG: HEAT repeat domain-containing protein [Actinomycetota bacterium]|nr:HEAT repeat domain-containing protein [Actinomycetota bacterium]